MSDTELRRVQFEEALYKAIDEGMTPQEVRDSVDYILEQAGD